MSEQAVQRNCRRSVVGTVSSDKMDKTIKVMIKRQIKHPMYEKRINRNTVLTAHDAGNEAGIGDIVEIMETRKLSKTKSWRLVKVISKAK